MGQFVILKTSEIIPSQDYLKPGTIEHIRECLRTGNTIDMPPEPFVRRHPQKTQYIAIDGHNKIAEWDHAGQDIAVYVADSPSDFLPGDSEGIADRNRDLAAKFDSALTEADRLNEAGISSFADLTAQYPDLFAK